jgi:hypothetical protein
MTHALLRGVFHRARAVGTVTAGAVAVAALSACGGGGTTGSPAPAPTPTPKPGVKFYQPLAVGNTWNYSCGNAVTVVDSVPAAQPLGNIEGFRFALQIPSGPSQTQLLANNVDGSTTLYGYLVGGSLTFVVPTVIVGVNPTPGQQFNYPGPAPGTVVARNFVGFSTSQTPLGVFNVAVYSENGGTDTYSYALATGIAEQKHGAFDCLLASFHLH